MNLLAALGFVLMSAMVGGASKVRLTENYNDDAVHKDDLYAEIDARREERKNTAGANLFVDITAKSNKPDMIEALEADDKATAQGGDSKPPEGLKDTGLKAGVAPVPPGHPALQKGGPVTSEQKAAAAKEEGAGDPRAQFIAMSEREGKAGVGGRLPVGHGHVPAKTDQVSGNDQNAKPAEGQKHSD